MGHLTDTIVAPATAPGRAAIAMIRISGPLTAEILAVVFRTGPGRGEVPKRRLVLGDLLGRDGRVIDRAMATSFEEPHSYTGEHMAEITLHGSPAVVREAISTCVKAGARPAEAGEFTLRALRAGKLDLAQAEAIHDLVEAATIEQARIAARQVGGEVSAALAPVASRLCDLQADLEAGLDFAEDEADLARSTESMARECERLAERLETIQEASETAHRVKEGARVVLIGAPNVGKSSLFNALVGYSRTIVTTEAGTTRDLVEETIVIDGLPVILVDAAGVGVAKGKAEEEGMRRAREAGRGAHLVLQLFRLIDGGGGSRAALIDCAQTMRVGTHLDLVDRSTITADGNVLAVSAVSGEGIPSLRKAIAGALGAPGARPVESVALATERHRAQAAKAQEALRRAARILHEGQEAELAAVDVRRAVDALREILGVVGPEQLLGRIFSRFCIGK